MVLGSRHSYQRPVLGFGRPWTPMVKILILVNGGVFLAQNDRPEADLLMLEGFGSD